MKVKKKKMSCQDVYDLPVKKRKRPIKQSRILRFLIKILSFTELRKIKFKHFEYGMEKLGKNEPCLILMNHSCFLDMKIACHIFKRRFNIVCTEDAFIGKKILLKFLGCVSTLKYLSDPTMVRDLVYIVKNLKQSILMYPEACYSFDGTATVLPESLAKCLKLLKIPVVVVQTKGAFARNPLYNNLQLRNVEVSADVTYALSPEDIATKSVDELNEIIASYFSFDNFKWQQDNKVKVSEPFRADSLNRILYKCPHCLTEGKMVGKGTTIVCEHCKKEYELTEYGYLKALNGDTKFDHIPNWVKWERECVKQEILDGKYNLETEVDIWMLKNSKCFYEVGSGVLKQDSDGFHLVGCDGAIDFKQPVTASYTLNCDFFFYEVGDVICIGDTVARYYCFPKNQKDIVQKARLAQEEMYKLLPKK